MLHKKTSEDVCTPVPGDSDDGKHESEEEKPEQIKVDLEDLARIADMVPLIEVCDGLNLIVSYFFLYI